MWFVLLKIEKNREIHCAILLPVSDASSKFNVELIYLTNHISVNNFGVCCCCCSADDVVVVCYEKNKEKTARKT